MKDFILLLQRAIPLLVLFIAVYFPRQVGATPADQAYLDLLLQQAVEKKIWTSREWKRLLHYSLDTQGRGGASRIDGGLFFLADDGHEDSVAEGVATLRSFFVSALGEEEDASLPAGRCTYPARFHFLQKVLEIDSDQLPAVSCPQLNQWISSINPAGLTLIFPVSYLNNPASMFGHTFFRIDSAEFSPGNPLLSSSVGFAAETDGEKGMTYAINGIFGGYRGRFSATNYYKQVRRYGGVENRDIWEYPLDFTPEETRFLLFHVWELRRAYFDYFFFDENCSYQLLALLEAVRPELRLTEQFPFWTLPIDTVTALGDAVGFAEQVTYRPSLKTRIEARREHLKVEQVQLARDLALGVADPQGVDYHTLQARDQAGIVELAADYLNYREAGGHLLNLHVDPLLRELLLVRSGIEAPAQLPAMRAPEARPDQGHAAARLNFGFGVEADEAYLQVGLRPVLHDIFDPPGGYDKTSSIQVLAPQFRWYPEQRRVNLESMEIVDIFSASPRDELFDPVAWRANLSLVRMQFEDGDRPLVAQGRGAFGLSYQLTDGAVGYGLAGGVLLTGPELPRLVECGPSAEIGVIASFTHFWRMGLVGEATYFLHDSEGFSFDIRVVQAVDVQHGSLRLEIGSRKEFAAAGSYAALMWNIYLGL